MKDPEPKRNRPRILVLGTEGGIGHAALSGDPSLDVFVVGAFTYLHAMLPRFAPHAIVVAIERPSPEDVSEFRKFSPTAGVPILVISKPIEERRVTEFIKAGAGGYLLEQDAYRAPQAIRELLRGGAPMSAPVSRLVLGRARRSSAKMPAVMPKPAPGAASLLTTRQNEILKLLANGHSYEDIGRALDVSVNTVRTHVRTIYERLGASTRIEAVMSAIDLQLLDRAR